MKTVILLPQKVRDKLQVAGQIKNYTERRHEVDRIIDLAKLRHPECFIPEDEPTTQEQENHVS